MRKLWAGIAISAAVHTAAAAWIARHPFDDDVLIDLPPKTTIEIVEVAPAKPAAPEAAPIEVAILDQPVVDNVADQLVPAPARIASAVPPTHAEPSRAPRATQPTEAITLPGAGAGSETAPEDPSKRSYLMDMRRGRVDLRVGHDDYGSAVDHAPAGTTPERDLTSGRLAPSGNGTYRTDDGPYTAKVGRDGSVKFTDKSNFNIHLALPTPKGAGRAISTWYEQDSKIPNDPNAVAVNVHRPKDEDTRPDSGATVPIVSGGFDVTDAFMRSHGQDPYASKKLAYLDSTRDERVQIGTRYRTQQLAQATQIMKTNLDRMFATVGDPAARKQALFELWDECAETGAAELVAAGAAARRLVVGAIRAHLPAGSATAYTADELVAFNRRKQSKATFAPYD